MADDPDGAEFAENEENVITNTNPNFLLSFYYGTTSFLASYGWFILFGIVFLIIIWSNIEKKVKKIVEKTKNSSSGELNPDELAKRAEAMELARQRQQEKASAIVQREAERRRELEEKKRAEKVEDFDAISAGRTLASTQKKLHLNEASPSTSNNPRPRPGARPLRDNDFNPLTGSSAPRYRPAPRRTGGG